MDAIEIAAPVRLVGQRQRAPQVALVGGEPADAGARVGGDRLGRDRSFGRPHAARPAAERACVRLGAAHDLRVGVGGIGERRRQRRIGHGAARVLAVDEERHDRMVEGRRRQLDLAARGELAIERQHAGAGAALPIDDERQIGAGKVARFLFERGDLVIALARGEAEPAEVEQHRQIAHVAVGERLLALALIEELRVARSRAHRAIPIEREEALDGKPALDVVPRVQFGDPEPLVDCAGDDLLELRHQRRHEVHRQLHVAVLVQQPRDVEIAARAVQAHPRQPRATRARIDILRLMHVQQEDDVRSTTAHRRALTRTGSPSAPPRSRRRR